MPRSSLYKNIAEVKVIAVEYLSYCGGLPERPEKAREDSRKCASMFNVF
jgi:hypothetical protein